jgi:D-alanyl-D-alanine carboxypeptidase/D-alanyl-D-alanine-endopeptidase (penicillin-binding protein 4)
VVVADLTGNVLWQVNASEPLLPASTVKLLTTGFARTNVGADARRATRVVGAGHVDPQTGTWVGKWALELNGDPTLERGDGPSLESLAFQLRAIGVRKLLGPLSVTSTEGEAKSTFPSVWASRYRGHLYAPPVGPITLNENVINLTIAPGAKVGSKAQIVGEAPDGIANIVTVTATTVSGTRSSLKFSALSNGHYAISGRIGVHAKPKYFAAVAHDPTEVLEAVWQRATAEAGIEWVPSPGMSSPGAANQRVLAEVVSQPFDSIASYINTHSINIGAELLLRWGGGTQGDASPLMAHVRSVTGLSDGITLVDGSGLSTSDRIAPMVFTSYLAKFPLTPGGKNFPMLLPANGSGTLKSLARGLPDAGVVRAKTGTLGNAATLVGYLGRGDGTLLIAAMYNGGHTYDARQMEWDLFRRLGANGTVIPADLSDEAAGMGGPDSKK